MNVFGGGKGPTGVGVNDWWVSKEYGGVGCGNTDGGTTVGGSFTVGVGIVVAGGAGVTAGGWIVVGGITACGVVSDGTGNKGALLLERSSKSIGGV